MFLCVRTKWLRMDGRNTLCHRTSFVQGACGIFPSCFAALPCEPNFPRRTLLTSSLSASHCHGCLRSPYTWLHSSPMKLSTHLLFMLSKAPMVKAASKLYEWSWVLISVLAAQCGILGALGPAAISFDVGNLSANYPASCSTVCWHSSFPTLQLIRLIPQLLTQWERWMIIKWKVVTSNQAICVCVWCLYQRVRDYLMLRVKQ